MLKPLRHSQFSRCKTLDIIVHNAGVTRDKTLARMPEHFWDMALNINLKAPIQVTDGLDGKDLLSPDARVICISSISGIAGNVGQTNYSASKSGVVGYVRKQAEKWQGTGKTINAIAPGFIETQMTDQIPFMTREVGRRMNSLSKVVNHKMLQKAWHYSRSLAALR